MTNEESARKLLKEAEYIFNEEVGPSLEESEYNLAVRRAQEVVELALKAGIKFLGGDFPKVHDAALVFAQLIESKGGKITAENLKLIQEISRSLSKDRAPAFYWEKDYSKEQAGDARDNAEFVLGEIKRIFNRE